MLQPVLVCRSLVTPPRCRGLLQVVRRAVSKFQLARLFSRSSSNKLPHNSSDRSDRYSGGPTSHGGSVRGGSPVGGSPTTVVPSLGLPPPVEHAAGTESAAADGGFKLFGDIVSVDFVEEHSVAHQEALPCSQTGNDPGHSKEQQQARRMEHQEAGEAGVL